jgi:hypothetical protein
MRVSKDFPVNLPVDSIDMHRWVTEMTSEDYESFAPAHKAMGSFFRGAEFLMVNVECIGSDLVVQHYQLTESSKSHVRFYSPRTTAYIYRWFPVTVGVPWEMSVRSTAEHSCRLSCTVGVDYPSRLLAIIAWLNGVGSLFLTRHLATEGAAFAKNIETKFATREPIAS